MKVKGGAPWSALEGIQAVHVAVMVDSTDVPFTSLRKDAIAHKEVRPMAISSSRCPPLRATVLSLSKPNLSVRSVQARRDLPQCLVGCKSWCSSVCNQTLSARNCHKTMAVRPDPVLGGWHLLTYFIAPSTPTTQTWSWPTFTRTTGTVDKLHAPSVTRSSARRLRRTSNHRR